MCQNLSTNKKNISSLQIKYGAVFSNWEWQFCILSEDTECVVQMNFLSCFYEKPETEKQNKHQTKLQFTTSDGFLFWKIFAWNFCQTTSWNLISWPMTREFLQQCKYKHVTNL